MRKSIGMWLSLVEHFVRDEGVAGSNPVIPTYKKRLRNKPFFDVSCISDLPRVFMLFLKCVTFVSRTAIFLYFR